VIRRRIQDPYCPPRSADGNPILDYAKHIIFRKVVTRGFAAGLISGFFGLGGGAIKIPALYHLGVPIHIAVATSAFMMVLTAFSSALSHASLGHVTWHVLLGIVPGVFLGAQIWARIASRAGSENLRRGVLWGLDLDGDSIIDSMNGFAPPPTTPPHRHEAQRLPPGSQTKWWGRITYARALFIISAD